MDRASASGAEGCEFESHRVRHNLSWYPLVNAGDSEMDVEPRGRAKSADLH